MHVWTCSLTFNLESLQHFMHKQKCCSYEGPAELEHRRQRRELGGREAFDALKSLLQILCDILLVEKWG